MPYKTCKAMVGIPKILLHEYYKLGYSLCLLLFCTWHAKMWTWVRIVLCPIQKGNGHKLHPTN